MSQWKKVQSHNRNVENILTRFLAKVKPLQEQLEAETRRLRQEIEKSATEGKDG
jgi:hypothetical protein